MEPISVLSGIGATLKAAEQINRILADADQLAPDDARYYATYLEVASQAIRGLEEEYIEILIEAAHCQLSDEAQTKHLLNRIDQYIHGEILRPKLKDAIEHLRIGEEALKQHTDRRIIWPTVRKNRMAAFAQFERLLNGLTGYLGSLGDYEGPSAVALEDVKKIKAGLAGSPEEFVDMIDDLLMNLDKGRLMSYTGDCARVIETLRLAFR